MDGCIAYTDQSGLERSGTTSNLCTVSAGMWGVRGKLNNARDSDRIEIFTSLLPILSESAILETQEILNDDEPDFTVDETSSEDMAKAEMEIGYGYSVLDGTAVVSPYSGATFVAGGRNSYRLGNRVEVGTGMRLELESGVENLNSGAMDRNIRIGE